MATKRIFIALVPALISVSAYADNQSVTAPEATRNQECIKLVGDCLKQGAVEKASCLYSTATHPVCEDSEAGKLAYKRWSMSMGQDSGLAGSPGLLGPQLVNEECVAKFDQRMAEEFSKDPVGEEAVHTLFSSLDSCRKELEIEMARP